MEPTTQEVEICQTGVFGITYLKRISASPREAARLACEAIYGTCFERTNCNGQSFYYGINTGGCSCFKSQNTYEWIYSSVTSDIGGFWCNTNTRLPLGEPFTRVVSPNVPGYICGRFNCFTYVNNYYTNCSTLDPTMAPTNIPSMTPTSRISRNVFCNEIINGSINPFEIDYYKLINIPNNTLSIKFDSCNSNYDTILQVYNDTFDLVSEWYVHVYLIGFIYGNKYINVFINNI